MPRQDKYIERNIHTRAHAGIDARREFWQEAREVAFVLECADLNLVAARQQTEFETDRTKIFETRLHAIQRASYKRQRPADRLKVDIVFEQRADDALEVTRILAERGVFQLYDIDLMQQDLALNQPLHLRRLEFMGSVRRDGGQVRIAVIAMHHELHALAKLAEFFVRRALAFVIEHDDCVDIAGARQFAQRM